MGDLHTGVMVCQRLKKRKHRLEIQKRVLHVFSEAIRVNKFRQTCETVRDPMSAIKKLGVLMNQSHESLRDAYDCSSDELESLRQRCLDGGALGSRLTGVSCEL